MIGDKIYDKPSNSGNFKVGAAAFSLVALMATVSFVKHLIEDSKDINQFYDHGDVNEMFCKAPGFADDFRGDPFAALNRGWLPDVNESFWQAAATGKQVTFPFSFQYNNERTSDRIKIPDDALNDENVHFILTGHAVNERKGDFESAIRMGVKISDDFMSTYAQHLRNIEKVASGRAEFVKDLLIEAGVPEDRIKVQNLGVAYDRQSVDLEVCGYSKPEL